MMLANSQSGQSGSGRYLDISFGICKLLYALRGYPGNCVEIWSLVSLSLVTLIPGAFYSNDIALSYSQRNILTEIGDTISILIANNVAVCNLPLWHAHRTSPISCKMVTIDHGTQDVVQWTIHSESSSEFLVCPSAVIIPPGSEFQVVDAIITADDDLYLLAVNNSIYYVDGNNETVRCCFEATRRRNGHSSLANETALPHECDQSRRSRLMSYHDGFIVQSATLNAMIRYKVRGKTQFELLEVYPLEATNALITINNTASAFKPAGYAPSIVISAVFDEHGLYTMDRVSCKLNKIEGFQGTIYDFAMFNQLVLTVERRHMRFLSVEDGVQAGYVCAPFDLHNVIVHPTQNIILVTAANEGSICTFKAYNSNIYFFGTQKLFSQPIQHILFSLRGDTLAVSTKMGQICLLTVSSRGCIEPVASKSVGCKTSSMAFAHHEEKCNILVILSRRRNERDIISIFEVTSLSFRCYLHLSESLYQIVECREANQIYATSFDGLKVFRLSFLLSEQTDVDIENVETMESYQQICWRRMVSDWKYLVVYGTDGRIDVFNQGNVVEKIFTVPRSFLTYSGYVKLAHCHQMKYIIGLQISGLLSCRSIKLRTNKESVNLAGCSLLQKEEPNIDDVNKLQKEIIIRSSRESHIDRNNKNESMTIKLAYHCLIKGISYILSNIKYIDEVQASLDKSFQDELRNAFCDITLKKNLYSIKFGNQKKKCNKLTENIIHCTMKLNLVLEKHAKEYSNNEEHKTSGKAEMPSMIKGVHDLTHNFYRASATELERVTAEGMLLYCTDMVSVSAGFDKYTSPRWSRKRALELTYGGSEAGLTSVSHQTRKMRKEDEEIETPKLDLNKKISEAVSIFATYFLKKRETERNINDSDANKEEERKSIQTSPPQMKIIENEKPETEFYSNDLNSNVKCQQTILTTLEADSRDQSDSDESSSAIKILVASDDGTEEEMNISSESLSSDLGFELPNNEMNTDPGLRSGYLMKLLERKENKRTRRFEVKEGMLKFYHQLTDNAKGFVKRFHGSTFHEFLHILPLCISPDETESIFVGTAQFVYTKYFIESLRETFNTEFAESKAMWEELHSNEEKKESDNILQPRRSEEKLHQIQSDSFNEDPLKPATALIIPSERTDSKRINNDSSTQTIRVHICPASAINSDILEKLTQWMKISMIRACTTCQKREARNNSECSYEEKGVINQEVPLLKNIMYDSLPKTLQETVSLIQLVANDDSSYTSEEVSSTSNDDEANGILGIFKWPEKAANKEEAVTQPALQIILGQELERSELSKLLVDSNTNYGSSNVMKNMLFDYVKRKKWYVETQVLAKTQQLTVNNYQAQMTRRLMEYCRKMRSGRSDITAYLNELNDKSSTLLAQFREMFQIYNEMILRLTELKHIKKVILHECKRFKIPGLLQYIDRMDSFQLNLQDNRSAEYIEEVIRSGKLFTGTLQEIAFNKLRRNATIAPIQSLGLNANLKTMQLHLWSMIYSWKEQRNNDSKDILIQEETPTIIEGRLKEAIFQTATDLCNAEISAKVTIRSLLLRLKDVYDTAIYVKGQYHLYKSNLIKLNLVESTGDSCAKQWINYERMLLSFKSKDLYKSSRYINLAELNSLIPTDYVGWEILLTASKADKILLRRAKKRNVTQISERHLDDTSSPQINNGENVRAMRKLPVALHIAPNKTTSGVGETHYAVGRRHSKVANARLKLSSDITSQSHMLSKDTSGYDVVLAEFSTNLKERGEELLVEMKLPDLVSTLKEENLENCKTNEPSNASSSKYLDIKKTFCNNPIYTNIRHLRKQDEEISSLENEYYEKLLCLINAKEDYRNYKADISNARTRMMNLKEEYAAIKKYIVSRDETHLIANISAMIDRIISNKVRVENESQKMSAEVKRSLRLMQKGKFEAVEWLLSESVAAKDDFDLSEEDNISKLSSAVSDQLRLSCKSERKDASSKSSVHPTSVDDQVVSIADKRQQIIFEQTSLIEECVEPLDKLSSVDEFVSLIREGKAIYKFCSLHRRTSVPPICCLLQFFQNVLNNDWECWNMYHRPEKSKILTKSSNTTINTKPGSCLSISGLWPTEIELYEILDELGTAKQDTDCKFYSENNDHSENDNSSHHSSLKLDTTLGSWTDSELEEVMDSDTHSSLDKLSSIVGKLMENKPKVIRQLTQRYLMDKFDVLFGDEHCEKIVRANTDENVTVATLRKITETEITEHQQDLMFLYNECSTGVPNDNQTSVIRAKQNLYEARLRSEILKEIRELKDRIAEKKALVIKMEEELEKLRLKRYPTFER